MKANELLKRIATKTAPVIIDPRSEMEFKKGHIPGAINAPVRKIQFNTANIPADGEVTASVRSAGCAAGSETSPGVRWGSRSHLQHDDRTDRATKALLTKRNSRT